MKAKEFVTELRKGQKDANGYTRCWPGKHAEGTKKGKNGGQVRNCVPNESVAEGHADQVKKVFKDKAGNPVGEIGIDPESSPGNGEWYVYHYGTGYSVVGFDSAAEAKRELMYVHKHPDAVAGHESTKEQGVAEAEGRVDPILIKALNRMPDGLATHREVLDAAYDAYAMELGKMAMRSEYGVTNRYIPQLLNLYKDKHGLTFNEAQEELAEEFDLIESIIEDLAVSNGVDSEVIWEDLESLDDDELYVFATTSTIMETISESRGGNYEQMGYRKSDKDKFVLLDRTLDSVILTTNDFAEAKKEAIEWAEYDDIRTEVIQQDTGKRVFTVDGYAGAEKYLDESEAWQKANNRDRTNGMSRKAVKAYRREHPGSKLQTAVTTKPSKLKKGSKASKRRKSYCSRSKGQMKMHNISCAKTPDKAICKARRRWNC